jgi:aspartyl-tRNA(Asn)/glutamyl-tRNA(Gln) amidotransferase subunit B
MPEPVHVKAARYAKDFGLSPQLAGELAAHKELSRFFEESARLGDAYQEMAGLIVGELEGGAVTGEHPLSPRDFVGLVQMVASNSISRAQAKEALRESIRSGRPVGEIVKLKNLSVVVDERAIGEVIERVIAAAPEALREAEGDKKAFSYLVGQVLKAEPKAQPSVVARLLAKRIRAK